MTSGRPDPISESRLPSRGAAFSLAGSGFHGGVPNVLGFARGPAGVGAIRIGSRQLRVRGPGAVAPLAASRCSRVDGAGPLEHLAAALAILGVDGWVLEADHPDLPLFDGSALAWVGALEATGPTFGPLLVACAEGGEWSDRRGSLSIRPSGRFRLKATWTDGPHGPEVWEGGEEDLPEVLAARTFVSSHDFALARQSGSLGGATVESGRLLRGKLETPAEFALAAELGVDPRALVWTGGAERMKGECAAHKALDLVGDLALALGGIPRASIEVVDAGHALHLRAGLELAGR